MLTVMFTVCCSSRSGLQTAFRIFWATDTAAAMSNTSFEYDDELVPIKSGDNVLGPNHRGHTSGRSAKHVIADPVPVRVVDRVEVIKVAEEQRGQPAAPGFAMQDPADDL
jgi:hypothetical protein